MLVLSSVGNLEGGLILVKLALLETKLSVNVHTFYIILLYFSMRRIASAGVSVGDEYGFILGTLRPFHYSNSMRICI